MSNPRAPVKIMMQHLSVQNCWLHPFLNDVLNPCIFRLILHDDTHVYGDLIVLKILTSNAVFTTVQRY